jgi:hypothetical protein
MKSEQLRTAWSLFLLLVLMLLIFIALGNHSNSTRSISNPAQDVSGDDSGSP